MSFMRGENYTQDQIRVFFICNNDINGNEDFHSDSFSHSPKGYIYLNQIDSQTRPFLYLSKSHKNYSDRIKLENLCGKKLYSGKNLFNHQSSRIKEYDQWKRYFDKHKLFVGLAKQGDFILADTAGFHAKGPGTKPRYALWIEPIRGNLLNKLIGILTLNNFFKKNNYSLN